MSAFTPGPWAVTPYSDVVGIAVCAPGAVIAGVRGDCRTAEANARLIAAAPAMHAALAKASAILAQLCERPDLAREIAASGACAHAREAARALLASIEGRS